jgi:hypothetical protein
MLIPLTSTDADQLCELLHKCANALLGDNAAESASPKLRSLRRA